MTLLAGLCQWFDQYLTFILDHSKHFKTLTSAPINMLLKHILQAEAIFSKEHDGEKNLHAADAVTRNVALIIRLFTQYYPFSCNSDSFFSYLFLFLQYFSRCPGGSGAQQRHRHQQFWRDWRWQRRRGDVSQAKGLCGKSAALCWLHLLQRGPVSLPRF